jgi:hypothetical protein
MRDQTFHPHPGLHPAGRTWLPDVRRGLECLRGYHDGGARAALVELLVHSVVIGRPLDSRLAGQPVQLLWKEAVGQSSCACSPSFRVVTAMVLESGNETSRQTDVARTSSLTPWRLEHIDPIYLRARGSENCDVAACRSASVPDGSRRV